jgi:hypothetical protein
MAVPDRYGNQSSGITGPGDDAFAVTPSDTVAFSNAARALYVGTTGDVTLITKGGTTIKFTAVPAGALIPVRCTQVNATGTTASTIVGIV